IVEAEDGVRDYTVTGVGTCALPVREPLLGKPTYGYWWGLPSPPSFVGEGAGGLGLRSAPWPVPVFEPLALAEGLPAAPPQPQTRSEERRVGKECRARATPSRVRAQK